MSKVVYGQRPPMIGYFPIPQDEVFYTLYLPISLQGMSGFLLPEPLKKFEPLVEAVYKDEPFRFRDEFVYVTSKRMFCGPNLTANRPGWHSDGFMSDDLNYVWHDALPTLFNDGPFPDVPQDHLKSLEYFTQCIDESKNYSFANNHLMKLDQTCIHRVAEATEQMMRSFVKISVSKNRYNLKGNSINHGLAYEWVTYDRKAVRNDPTAAQLDYRKE